MKQTLQKFNTHRIPEISLYWQKSTVCYNSQIAEATSKY